MEISLFTKNSRVKYRIDSPLYNELKIRINEAIDFLSFPSNGVVVSEKNVDDFRSRINLAYPQKGYIDNLQDISYVLIEEIILGNTFIGIFEILVSPKIFEIDTISNSISAFKTVSFSIGNPVLFVYGSKLYLGTVPHENLNSIIIKLKKELTDYNRNILMVFFYHLYIPKYYISEKVVWEISGQFFKIKKDIFSKDELIFFLSRFQIGYKARKDRFYIRPRCDTISVILKFISERI